MKLLAPLLLVLACEACNTAPPAADPVVARDSIYRFSSDELPAAAETGELGGRSVTVSPMDTATEGVYFFRNGFSTLILELASGTYRYWFLSDVGRAEDYLSRYPVTGRYSVQGAIVRLSHEEPYAVQPEWAFRMLDGQATLWRPSAVRAWHEKRSWDCYGILYRTKMRPEDIWMKDVWKSGP